MKIEFVASPKKDRQTGREDQKEEHRAAKLSTQHRPSVGTMTAYGVGPTEANREATSDLLKPSSNEPS